MKHYFQASIPLSLKKFYEYFKAIFFPQMIKGYLASI